MPGIKCGVEECEFQKKMECHATGIAVMSSGDLKVNTSDGTCCQTFRPKH